jgi:hypothetical protein
LIADGKVADRITFQFNTTVFAAFTARDGVHRQVDGLIVRAYTSRKDAWAPTIPNVIHLFLEFCFTRAMAGASSQARRTSSWLFLVHTSATVPWTRQSSAHSADCGIITQSFRGSGGLTGRLRFGGLHYVVTQGIPPTKVLAPQAALRRNKLHGGMRL